VMCFDAFCCVSLTLPQTGHSHLHLAVATVAQGQQRTHRISPTAQHEDQGSSVAADGQGRGQIQRRCFPVLVPQRGCARERRREGKGENTERIPREYRENTERIPREYREKREKREKRKKRANREKRETRENRENIEGDQSTVQKDLPSRPRFVSFLTFHKHVCSLDQQIGPNRFHHQQPLKRGQLAPPRRKQQPLPLLKPPTILERERHRGKSRNKPRDIEGKIEGYREGYRGISRIIENYREL
jgi:hypothetical protein